MLLSRRQFAISLVGLPVLALPAGLAAQTRDIWAAKDIWAALEADEACLLDIRSRGEWQESGVAQGAWPVSMHEKRFPERLFQARDLAGDRPVALICATGGRTGSVLRALRGAGYDGYVDVAEGMLGSRYGQGWLALKLPVVSADTALAELPASLV